MTTTEQERLENVVKSLDRVNQATKQAIFDLSCSMSEMEIVQRFNQQAHDLYTMMNKIIKKMEQVNEYKISGYKAIFDNAIKINAKLPIDKFTLLILEFAAEIYSEDEDCFLKMSIPDKKVSSGNEFAIIRSEKFKELWKVMCKHDQKLMTDNVILLTTYAHAYLYKTLLKNKQYDKASSLV